MAAGSLNKPLWQLSPAVRVGRWRSRTRRRALSRAATMVTIALAIGGCGSTQSSSSSAESSTTSAPSTRTLHTISAPSTTPNTGASGNSGSSGGSGSSASDDATSYRARINELCASANAQIEALPASDASNVAGLRTELAIDTTTLAQVKAVSIPRSLSSEANRWLSDVEQNLALAKKAVRDLQAGNVSAAESLVAQGRSTKAAGHAAATLLGVPGCAKNPAPGGSPGTPNSSGTSGTNGSASTGNSTSSSADNTNPSTYPSTFATGFMSGCEKSGSATFCSCSLADIERLVPFSTVVASEVAISEKNYPSWYLRAVDTCQSSS